VEPVRLWIPNAVEVIDPDGRIDYHHRPLLRDATRP
jgi:hypothetical protein